jgi:chaperonin GroES
MKFRPLHDRVIVERIDPDAKSAGGIIIPDTAQEKPSQGEIIAVGPGGRDESGKLIPIDLKVGDRVLCTADADQFCRPAVLRMPVQTA